MSVNKQTTWIFVRENCIGGKLFPRSVTTSPISPNLRIVFGWHPDSWFSMYCTGTITRYFKKYSTTSNSSIRIDTVKSKGYKLKRHTHALWDWQDIFGVISYKKRVPLGNCHRYFNQSSFARPKVDITQKSSCFPPTCDWRLTAATASMASVSDWAGKEGGRRSAEALGNKILYYCSAYKMLRLEEHNGPRPNCSCTYNKCFLL